MKLPSFSIIIIAAIGCSSNQQLSKDFETGIKLVNEGLPEQAMPYLDKEVKARPNAHQPYRARSKAYLDISIGNEAHTPGVMAKKGKADADMALKIKPDDAQTLYNWGTYCLLAAIEMRGAESAKFAKEAEQYIQRAIDANPDEMTYRKQLQLAREISKRGW